MLVLLLLSVLVVARDEEHEMVDGEKVEYHDYGVEFVGNAGHFKLFEQGRWCQIEFDKIEEFIFNPEPEKLAEYDFSSDHMLWIKKPVMDVDGKVTGTSAYFEVNPLSEAHGGRLRVETLFFPSEVEVKMPDNRTSILPAAHVKFNIIISQFPWLNAASVVRMAVEMHCERIKSDIDKKYEKPEEFEEDNVNEKHYGFSDAGFLILEKQSLTVDGVPTELDLTKVEKKIEEMEAHVKWQLPHFQNELIMDPLIGLGVPPFDWRKWSLYGGLTVGALVLLGAGVFCFIRKRKSAAVSTGITRLV